MVVDVVYQQIEIAANNQVSAEKGPEEPPAYAQEVSRLVPGCTKRACQSKTSDAIAAKVLPPEHNA